MKISKFFGAASAACLLALPLAANTVCTNETLAGQWRGGDYAAVCDLNFRAPGGVRATCGENEYNDAFDRDEYTEFDLAGRINIEPDCSVRLRLVDPFGEAVILFGRVWGSAGAAPDAGILSTRRGPDQINITIYRK